MGRLCSLKRSLRRRLVFPIYCSFFRNGFHMVAVIATIAAIATVATNEVDQSLRLQFPYDRHDR